MLRKHLGSGGNGEVWGAERNSQNVALKILKEAGSHSEPYKRFVTEIRVLRDLGPRPDILPLLDSHLPAYPSRNDPAWLTMPIATVVRDVLPGEAPLRMAVEAIYAVSKTLAELAATRTLHHRDIKPENLFFFDGRWCIGDFGLVDDPIGEPLTEVGKLLGARHYLAPELYRSDNCDWSSADLYALAKTLWVLILGQKFPPPGHLVRSVQYFRLSTQIQADHTVRFLERLIERSTDPDPGVRPSMQEFSEELALWLNPPERLRPTEPSEATKELIRAAVTDTQELELRRRRLRAHVDEQLTSLRGELTDLGLLIESLTGLTVEYGVFPELSASSQVSELSHLPESYYVSSWGCRVTAPLKRRGGLVNHVSGVALCTTTSGEVHMVVMHVLLASPGAQVVLPWIQKATAAMGSLVEQKELATLLAGLRANAPKALEVFAQLINS